ALSARSTIVRRRASRPAFPRRACGTIIPTIVRRSASHAVLDAPRPIFPHVRGDYSSPVSTTAGSPIV
ncbi:hypothetical protein CVE34_08450, partial [Pseudomonas syringae pv. actinidiae]|nr:hypothetical protein [Pseudomonas syringae pv. actinidiae]